MVESPRIPKVNIKVHCVNYFHTFQENSVLFKNLY